MSLSLGDLVLAERTIVGLAQNEPDAVVRSRARELAQVLREEDRPVLFGQVLATATNTGASQAARLRALDLLAAILKEERP